MNHAADAGFAIHLFGTPQVCVAGTPLTGIGARQADRLLAHLVLAAGQMLPSDPLAERLWPDTGSHDSLYQCVRHLRHLLGTEAGRLQSGRGELKLDLAGAFVDVLAFAQLVEQGDADTLEAALALYQRGTLLDGWERDEAVWRQDGEWALKERGKVRDKAIQAQGQLIRLFCAQGQPERALALLRSYVQARPQEEWAWCLWMQALADTHARLEAVKIYTTCRDYFHKHGLPPPSAMTRLLHQIQAGTPPHAHIALSHTPPTGDTTAPSYREPIGGAVPMNSPYYIERAADATFAQAIAHQDSLVLVKGPRQTGKTSLLARGLHYAREIGCAVALTDMQKLGGEQWTSADAFYLALAQSLADQLELDVLPRSQWTQERSANDNFERYLRRVVLHGREQPLVWGLDEVDRLFPQAYSGEVFALFRSWHNERAFDATGPWSRLTLAIAYATEAHLFIADLNQSPFNVGTRLTLDDFTFAQVQELNERYDRPLSTGEEQAAFFALVGGSPYLVRRGLHEMTTRPLKWTEFVQQAAQDEGCYGDHLRRILLSLTQDQELCAIVRGLLQGQPCPTPQSFYRLRSGGLLTGQSLEAARFRCALYRAYLETHLP